MNANRVYCQHCQAWQDLDLDDALLLIPDVGKASLSFLCPSCGSRRVVPAAADKVDALAAAGVPAERLDFAVPSGHIAGPPISEDDVIAFGREIEAATVIV